MGKRRTRRTEARKGKEEHTKDRRKEEEQDEDKRRLKMAGGKSTKEEAK